MRHVRDPENICAAILIVAFFLPWATPFIPVAGYELPELGGGWWLAWALPVFSLGVIALGVLGVKRLWLSVLTGLLPLAGLAYVLTKLGGAVFEILQFGGYLTLLAGIALIAAAFGTRAKREPAAAPTPEAPGSPE